MKYTNAKTMKVISYVGSTTNMFLFLCYTIRNSTFNFNVKTVCKSYTCVLPAQFFADGMCMLMGKANTDRKQNNKYVSFYN